jgi:uncharacterized protein YceK
MIKYVTGTLLFFMVTLSLIVSGCGSVDSPTASSATDSSQSTVYGVASLETSTEGTVSVKDSSVTPQEITVAISSDGSYTADVSGLTAPFVLKASGTDHAGEDAALYSVSTNGGRANINEISDTAVAAAADDQNADQNILYTRFNNYEHHRTTDKFDEVINSLRTVLAPLFALYEVSGNPVTDDENEHNEHGNSHSGLRALLRDVSFRVNDGTVTVKNRATGGIIFSGPLNDLASGTFYPENMPAGTGGATACTYTYSDWGVCQSDGTQLRTMLTSTPSGCTGTPVLSQSCSSTSTCSSFTYSDWGTCTNGTQTRTIATSSPTGCTGGTPAVLSQSCTSTCSSFTYSAWGTCTNGTQTRTIATSSPTGCTGGTPAALSQSCTSSSTVTKANITSSCTGCHGLTVNTTVFKSGGYTVTGRSASNWLTSVNSMVKKGASLASGTTAQDYADFLAALP